MAASDTYKLAKLNARAAREQALYKLVSDIVTTPAVSTMGLWMLNQTLWKAGFYDNRGVNSSNRGVAELTYAEQTKNATAQWIAGFGMVQAAVVASKAINLPEMVGNAFSALGALK